SGTNGFVTAPAQFIAKLGDPIAALGAAPVAERTTLRDHRPIGLAPRFKARTCGTGIESCIADRAGHCGAPNLAKSERTANIRQGCNRTTANEQERRTQHLWGHQAFIVIRRRSLRGRLSRSHGENRGSSPLGSAKPFAQSFMFKALAAC